MLLIFCFSNKFLDSCLYHIPNLAPILHFNLSVQFSVAIFSFTLGMENLFYFWQHKSNLRLY